MNSPPAPKKSKLHTTTFAPILSDELTKNLPLTEVYVATIKDPKTISKAVLHLNTVSPIQQLIHLKRVRGRQILLMPKLHCTIDQVLHVLCEKGFDCSLFEDQIEIKTVAEIAPKVRSQYEIINKLWPCNFHANPYLEKLSTNTIFSSIELEDHTKFMRITIEIAKISRQKYATLIVDPSTNSIVSFGFDQSTDYPTKHSVMVAIDNVAKTQNGGQWKSSSSHNNTIEMNIRKFLPDTKFHINHEEDGSYLCTGYSVYCTFEPCITCAMALVHSRAKRVFYGGSTQRGALGSVCKIHVVENLNHHYEVFSGLLKQECQELEILTTELKI